MDINGIGASEYFSLYQPQKLKMAVANRITENSAEQFQPNDLERYNQSIIDQTNSVNVETYSPGTNNPIGNTKGNILDVFA